MDLSRGRPRDGMGGVGGIPYTELAAYTALTKDPLVPWEVQVIRSMDSLYLTEIHRPDTEIGKMLAEEMAAKTKG